MIEFLTGNEGLRMMMMQDTLFYAYIADSCSFILVLKNVARRHTVANYLTRTSQLDICKR